MSFIVKLIIGGWLSTFAIIGVCALNQSGKLLKFRNRLASWIEVREASFLPSSVKSALHRTARAQPDGRSLGAASSFAKFRFAEFPGKSSSWWSLLGTAKCRRENRSGRFFNRQPIDHSQSEWRSTGGK